MLGLRLEHSTLWLCLLPCSGWLCLHRMAGARPRRRRPRRAPAPARCPSPPPPQAGVASGPQALGLLRVAGMPALAPLSSLCLSLIALAAGAELHLPELRRLRRQASRAPRRCRPAPCACQAHVAGLACARAKALHALVQAARLPGSPLPPALLLPLLHMRLQVACVSAGVAVFSWVLVYAWCAAPRCAAAVPPALPQRCWQPGAVQFPCQAGVVSALQPPNTTLLCPPLLLPQHGDAGGTHPVCAPAGAAGRRRAVHAGRHAGRGTLPSLRSEGPATAGVLASPHRRPCMHGTARTPALHPATGLWLFASSAHCHYCPPMRRLLC